MDLWASVLLVAAFSSAWALDLDYLPPKCKPCDARTCPILRFCAGGVVVKDHCGCCTRCSSDLFQPHVPLPPTKNKGNACEQVKCQKFKVCMVNVQGVPLCMCPSAYICRTRRRRKSGKTDLSVCGSDGVTYESRCHLRIEDCNSRKRIKVAHKGSCELGPTPENSKPKAELVVKHENPADREERIKNLVRETRKKDRRKRKKRRQRRHNRYREQGSHRALKGRRSRKSYRYFKRNYEKKGQF